MFIFIKSLIYLFSILFSSYLFSQEEHKTTEMENYFIQKSRNLQIAKHPLWSRLLFYQKKILGDPKGIIDSKNFYVSPNGKTDLTQELEATLKAFFKTAHDPNYSAQCLFPRRTKWLKQMLDDKNFQIPTMQCPELEKWITMLNPKGVVLVFSSFYLNNPSSMFGHTFLRIRNSNNALTDYGINFAAVPDADSAVMYSLKGLFGFFEGYIRILPYSFKIQEYNNSESRDIWEYELNFSQEQNLDLALSILEIGNHNIDYYYFDENCSFILLALLDTVDENFKFSDKFTLWVNPADTIRLISSHPNMIKSMNFRPSAEKRFRYRYQLLTKHEQQELHSILKQKQQLTLLTERLPPHSIAKILDGLLEYIDYEEKLAGTETAKKYSQLREDVLKYRASLRIISDVMPNEAPPFERPDQGPAGTSIGIEFNHSTRHQTELQFEFIPVLHTLDSPSLGYPKDAHLELLSTALRYNINDRALSLSKIHLVNLVSIPPLYPPSYPIAWNLNIGAEELNAFQNSNQSSAKLLYFAKGGAGMSLQFQWLQFYVLPQIGFAYQNKKEYGIATGSLLGFIVRPTETWVVFTEINWMSHLNILNSSWNENFLADMSLSKLTFDKLKMTIFARYNSSTAELKFGFGVFFHFF